GDHRDLHSFPTRRSADMTCTRLEWVTKPSASSLVRSRQLLVRLFVNGSNTKQLSIALGLGKISPRVVLVIIRKVQNNPRTTQGELVNVLKPAGTTVTKKTIGNTLRRNGLKYCSTRKVPLLKEARVKGRLKFTNEHLNDSKEDWETGCGQMRPKSSSLASTRLAAFGG